MKLKLFIGIALAVVLVAGLWWRFQHSASTVAPVIRQEKTEAVVLPKPVPVNNPKMTTITGNSRVASTTAPLASSDWDAVQIIVDSKASYQTRMEAISSLSTHITEADWEVLKNFLLKPDAMDHGQLGQVIKNQLLDVSCAQEPPLAELGDVLTQIYQDQKQDDVIRDYAVQHMVAYYEQMSNQSNSQWTLESVHKVLWQAINEPVGSIGGTALLALTHLSQEYGKRFDQSRISAAALQMAGNPIAGEMTRITAFQVCAQLGATDALPVVLKAAENGETTSLRISAIGSLSLLGGAEQIPYLNSVLQGAEDRLKPAAEHALAQIMARQKQMAGQK